MFFYFYFNFLIDFEARYIDKTWEEIEYLLAYEQLKKQKHKGEETQAKVDLMAEFENIVEQATALTDLVRDKTISKSKKVKGIRDNRSFEKEKRRKEEAFELNKEESPIPVDPTGETSGSQQKTTSNISSSQTFDYVCSSCKGSFRARKGLKQHQRYCKIIQPLIYNQTIPFNILPNDTV